MAKIVFHIYLAGSTSSHKQFLQLYQNACAQQLKAGSFDVNVFDLLKKPEWAEKYKILATPTISRIFPEPEKRVIGKLDEEQALKAVIFLIEDLSI